MSFILSLIVAFSIGFTGTPSQAPSEAPSQASVSAQCEEDEPCWDCETMGNKQCGDTHTADAWATIDAAHITAPATQDGMMLSYVGWTDYKPTASPNSSYFVLQSNTDPRIYYVFQWEALRKA